MKDDDLAIDLTNANSKLYRLAQNIELQPASAQPLHVKEATFQIRTLCAQYRRCGCGDSNCVYCASGRDGKPFRNDLCKRCVMSQLTQNSEFIGPPSVRHLTLREAFVQSQSEQA